MASFSGLTMASRLTGLLRDVTFSTAFGAGPASDAFVLAFRIPNALRRLFADGALSAAFVPALVKAGCHSPQRFASFIARMSGTLAVVVAVVCVAGMLFATPLATVFAPGAASQPGQLALIAHLLRLTFPFLFCISLAALAGAVLMSQGRFSRWALAPALLNLSMAAGAGWLAPRLSIPITAMAWAVLIGGILQAAWLWAEVAKLGLLRRPRWGGGDARVRAVARTLLPTVASASVAQVNLLFASAMASLLATGSQTWLFQADRFLELPLALFGASMGIVLLPTLARETARDAERAARMLAVALRWVTLSSLPATVGLVLLAEPLMLTFFQYGRYTAYDAHMAAAALASMSLGLPALAAIKVMLPAYYARGDLVTPVRVSCVALACTIACSLLFMAGALLAVGRPLAMAQWPGALAMQPGLHAWLALAGAIANGCNALLLWRGLRRVDAIGQAPDTRTHVLRIVAACTLMGLWLLPLRDRMDFEGALLGQRVMMLLTLAASGAAIFLAAWYCLGGRLADLASTDG